MHSSRIFSTRIALFTKVRHSTAELSWNSIRVRPIPLFSGFPVSGFLAGNCSGSGPVRWLDYDIFWMFTLLNFNVYVLCLLFNVDLFCSFFNVYFFCLLFNVYFFVYFSMFTSFNVFFNIYVLKCFHFHLNYNLRPTSYIFCTLQRYYFKYISIRTGVRSTSGSGIFR